MIMRFRPANIRLINRRSNPPRLLLALSSGKSKNNDNYKSNPTDPAELTRSLHITQLPTDHDYAVPTREYQPDQSSLKPAQAAARSVLGKKQKQRQLQKQPHRSSGVDTVTPYQGNALIQPDQSHF